MRRERQANTMTYKALKRVKLGAKIKRHALGDIHRMNAKSADCYAFSYDTIGQKYLDGTVCTKLDWSGGWDWMDDLVDKSASHILELSTGQFYEIIQ